MFQMSFSLWLLYLEDRTDLEFACGLGIDWLALSLPARNVIEARELAKGRAAILSRSKSQLPLQNLMIF